MNKIMKILLAILGGIDTTLHLFIPIILAALWVSVSGLNGWQPYFLYGIALFATLFRAIKIGFINNY